MLSHLKAIGETKLLLKLQLIFISGLYLFIYRNGVKIDAKPPRLFCDICDLFDLHDTEDCPTQASEDLNNSPPFSNQRQMPSFNQNSPSYKQHSHHGGMRGAMRPYCDNCEGTFKFYNLQTFFFV
jgi:hypothetical protein